MNLKTIAVLCCLVASCNSTDGQPYGNDHNAAKYCNVGDARIYYEVYGSGEPIVLFHGGLFGSIAEFSKLIPELAKDHMVIAIATRGHERSDVGNRPLSYALLADDFSRVIKAVTTSPVIVIGFSDGAIAAYHLASGFPNLVKKLVAVGGPLGQKGYTPKGRKSLSTYDTPSELEALAPAFVKRRKAMMADSSKWIQFCEGLASMWKEDQYISSDAFRAIKCPTLLIAGDHDEYTATDHISEAREMLSNAELAIIPGAGHTVFATRPELMAKLIRDFIGK